MPSTRLLDVFVPSLFTAYSQQQTAIKSNLIQSGVLMEVPSFSSFLNDAGGVLNVPSFRPLAITEPNSINDDPADFSSPKNIGSSIETAPQLDLHESWGLMRYTKDLSSGDPMAAILSDVSNYWSAAMQNRVLSILKGVFADNDAAPTAAEHVRYDLTYDLSTTSLTPGGTPILTASDATRFNGNAVVSAGLLMGDSSGDLAFLWVHSIVHGQMQKQGMLQTTINPADGRVLYETYFGKRVVVDDSLPAVNGVYDSYLLGAGALGYSMGTRSDATELQRVANSGKGGGEDILHNRVRWIIHPVGHEWAAGTTNPSRSAMEAATAYRRVYPQRKQIKIVRLRTREFTAA
jgi:hypothetical protein